MAGEIMAIKGIGGFHLAVDATNEAAVMRLRERKHRYGKPLAIMVRDLDAARAVCELTSRRRTLLITLARPIVLARAPRRLRNRRFRCAGNSLARRLSALRAVAASALCRSSRVRALVMTSANLSEEPIAIDNDEALARLGQIADAFLMHDREILQRCDDSVMASGRRRAAVAFAAPAALSRSPFRSPSMSPPLLAVGGHLKNVFALARGRFAYQSQHLGDLENLTGLDFFRESLAHLMHTFEIEPEAVVARSASRLSVDNLGERMGRRARLAADRRAASPRAHRRLHGGACARAGRSSASALDGTGYGTDGRIWGGEVLIVASTVPS